MFQILVHPVTKSIYVTQKKKQQIPKPVHYIFVFNHKISKQDKTFIFLKIIYENVLLFCCVHIC